MIVDADRFVDLPDQERRQRPPAGRSRHETGHQIDTSRIARHHNGPRSILGLSGNQVWGVPLPVGYALIPGVLQEPYYTHGILSIAYVPRNIYAMLLRSWNFVDRFPWLQPSWWGLGLFFTTPLFLWLVKARANDPRVAWAGIGTIAGLIPIVTHGNIGFAQFGYRYSLDVQPLLLIALATVFEPGISRLAVAASVASIAINAYGVAAIGAGFVAF